MRFDVSFQNFSENHLVHQTILINEMDNEVLLKKIGIVSKYSKWYFL